MPICSFLVLKRESSSMRTGNDAKRAANVRWCCEAKSVVGTRIATCFLSAIALNAARTATSVLP